ncbi:thioredoxin-like protein [Lichtheimia hyalospora FSU 10163]|nr:thioredoxin-like protein [Lichtheimia hyalospora FSU 10163]
MADYKFKEPKNLEEFHKLISENKKVVIDFHATWCGPCKLIAPKFKAFALEHSDVVFAKVDVDEVPDVAAEVAVRAMPTFVFYQDGQKVDDVVGANAAKLQQAIESLSKA